MARHRPGELEHEGEEESALGVTPAREPGRHRREEGALADLPRARGPERGPRRKIVGAERERRSGRGPEPRLRQERAPPAAGALEADAGVGPRAQADETVGTREHRRGPLEERPPATPPCAPNAGTP